MAELAFVRIDSRMIHGQITTAWNNVVRASKIIVIDDIVAGDEIMSMGLQFAAPPNTEALVYSVEEAVKEWEKDQFGKGRAMILFRDVQTAYRSWKGGFGYTKLNIGNIPIAEGRVSVYKTCYMNKQEAELLKEMDGAGVEIYLQFMPPEKVITFDKLYEKVK